MAPRVSDAYRDRRRREVLAAADRVFVRLGYRDATMDDVMTEVGLSRGGLYRYFPGKAELFWGLLRRQDDAALARLHGLADNGRPLADQILRLFTAQVAHAATEAPRARMILEFRLQHGEEAPYAGALEERGRRYRAALAFLLATATARGEMRPLASADDTARYLLGLHDGMAIMLGVAAASGDALSTLTSLWEASLAAAMGFSTPARSDADGP